MARPTKIAAAVLSLAIALSMLLPGRPAAALTTDKAAAKSAADYLVKQLVDSSGGKAFESPYTGEADPGNTALGLLALVSAGGHATEVGQMTTYLKAVASTYVTGTPDDVAGKPGRAANLALAAAATGESPTNFGGVNLVTQMKSAALGNGQLTGQGVYADAIILLALKRSNVALPLSSCSWLASQQADDGSFGYVYGVYTPDVDSTSVALQALAACGQLTFPAVEKARDWFAGQKTGAGYWDSPYSPVNSTGLAVSALGAIGVDSPAAVKWLVKQQNTDGGLPGSKDTPTVSDAYATIQALFALAGTSFLSVGPNPVKVTLAMAGDVFACTAAGNVWVVIEFPATPPARTTGCAIAPATGLDALFQVTTVGQTNGFVQQLDGRPTTDEVIAGAYWNYFHADSSGNQTWGPWKYSNTGAGGYQPQPGSMEGWAYGKTGTSISYVPPAPSTPSASASTSGPTTTAPTTTAPTTTAPTTTAPTTTAPTTTAPTTTAPTTTAPAAISISSPTVAQGDMLTVVGRGFASPVTGTVHSDPIDLGVQSPDSSGSVTFTFSTAGLAPGDHTVTLASDGLTLTGSFTVTASSALAAAGSGVPPVAVAAAILVLVSGIGLVVAGRRTVK